MQYQNIVKAKFISRPNRFIANVEVDGRPEISHVKNTGRCKELLIPGCTVYLEDFAGRMRTRKIRYSLIAVEKVSLLINMDSQAPNKIVCEALKSGMIYYEELGKLSIVKPETVYGDSRFDFYVEDENGKKGFIEVKGCTLENDGVASFPDAPTERGVKHIEGLIKAKKDGYFAGIVFAVQMEGMRYLVPNDETHKAFGDALRKADANGVSVRAFECRVTPDSLFVDHEIEVRL